MLPDEYFDDIRFAMSQIRKELDASGVLFRVARIQELDHIQALAAAVVIHSVYTGIETILQLLHKMTWGRLPESRDWHNSLLRAFSNEGTDAPLIIPSEIQPALLDLLGFRHRFRHGYAYQLNESLVTEKLMAIEIVWEKIGGLLDELLERHRRDK